MVLLNSDLQKYIEERILPQYKEDHSGHGLQHIQYVIRRSFLFADRIPDINYNMVYAVAAYHDLGHSIDPKHHEILSAKMFLMDKKMLIFFNPLERKTIAEAIEDHRASSNHEPRTIYGKIVSTADRSTDVAEFLCRTHQYSLKHEPELSFEEHIERAFQHMQEKYGVDGYAPSYFNDPELQHFKSQIRYLLENKKEFKILYQNINKEKDLLK